MGPSSVIPFWMVDLTGGVNSGLVFLLDTLNDEVLLKLLILGTGWGVFGVNELVIVTDRDIKLLLAKFLVVIGVVLFDFVSIVGENNSSNCLLADKNGSYSPLKIEL